ncbi:hypothetical protein WN51_06189 [Melipona quadrifasciata]|uniref:Uncharacterized protein n=1 Tax=Melipona quadrifasciata TaxID=166423 RepID=A0A0N0BCK2_9HYME|nr:hypothetical protein WN51_06189 [Melipona quadrifasciata]
MSRRRSKRLDVTMTGFLKYGEISNTRLAQAASGCAPSVHVLPIFDVKQQSVRNPARMGDQPLVGLVLTTSVWGKESLPSAPLDESWDDNDDAGSVGYELLNLVTWEKVLGSRLLRRSLIVARSVISKFNEPDPVTTVCVCSRSEDHRCRSVLLCTDDFVSQKDKGRFSLAGKLTAGLSPRERTTLEIRIPSSLLLKIPKNPKLRQCSLPKDFYDFARFGSSLTKSFFGFRPKRTQRRSRPTSEGIGGWSDRTEEAEARREEVVVIQQPENRWPAADGEKSRVWAGARGADPADVGKATEGLEPRGSASRIELKDVKTERRKTGARRPGQIGQKGEKGRRNESLRVGTWKKHIIPKVGLILAGQSERATIFRTGGLARRITQSILGVSLHGQWKEEEEEGGGETINQALPIQQRRELEKRRKVEVLTEPGAFTQGGGAAREEERGWGEEKDT